MNVVGLRLNVQLHLTQSLSDNPVLSIFFLGGIYRLFHGVDTVVLFSLSGFSHSIYTLKPKLLVVSDLICYIVLI